MPEDDVAAMLATFGLAARIALAMLLAVAGVNKLRNPYGAATAAVNFRIVGQATPGVGYTLGAVELATAVLLVLPAPIGLVGCAAAGLLVALFAHISIRALTRGERFPCGCLSNTGSEQLSWTTVIRALLMGAAAVIGVIGIIAAETRLDLANQVSAIGLATIALGCPVAVRLAWRIRREHSRFLKEAGVR